MTDDSWNVLFPEYPNFGGRGKAPSAPGPLMEPLNSTAVMTNLSNILIKLLKKC